MVDEILTKATKRTFRKMISASQRQKKAPAFMINEQVLETNRLRPHKTQVLMTQSGNALLVPEDAPQQLKVRLVYVIAAYEKQFKTIFTQAEYDEWKQRRRVEDY